MVLLLCGQFGTQIKRPIQQARESPMGARVLQAKDSWCNERISIGLGWIGLGLVDLDVLRGRFRGRKGGRLLGLLGGGGGWLRGAF